jgi:hypothetical protein
MNVLADTVLSVDCSEGRHHLCRPDRYRCDCECHGLAEVASSPDSETSPAGRPASSTGERSSSSAAGVHVAALSESGDDGAADQFAFPVTEVFGEVGLHTQGDASRAVPADPRRTSSTT